MPTWLIQVLVGAALMLVAYMLRPKPEEPKAATLDEIDIPRSTEGDEIGMIFGTAWINSPQVAWFGDYLADPLFDDGSRK